MVARDLLIDSLYHLHVDANVNLNEQIMSAVGQRRFKDEINKKYLCHHRLDHIGEDRINKLKKDGIISFFIQSRIQLVNLAFEKKWPNYPL